MAAPRARGRRPRRALALAGGGPLGAMYEIGVLLALNDSMIGLDLNDMDIYVGVSAGSFLTAGLANGMTPAEIYRLFIANEPGAAGLNALSPEIFLRPALGEYWSRLKRVPGLMLHGVSRYAANPFARGGMESLAPLSRAIPAGLFDGEYFARYLRDTFHAPGRSNDFRKLSRKLYSVAVDLDTGETVAFGKPGHDHVPISRAVQASAALPGLFPPVEIDGRHYVDGALRKTLNASLALEDGARLVIGVNPLVPFDGMAAKRHGRGEVSRLVDGGLPAVLSQTFRTLIHSRMHTGLEKYAACYRDADIVLFEPSADDPEMFFTNPFSYASRKRVCEHAYRRTRTDLAARAASLSPVLARHGITLDLRALRDETRTPDGIAGIPASSPRLRMDQATRELSEALNDLSRWLQTHTA